MVLYAWLNTQWSCIAPFRYRLKRDEHTDRFDDGDLARLLQSATADCANAFRARGIPAAFKVIEIMGIQQSRAWGVCSLNEFRSFLGLKRTFTVLPLLSLRYEMILTMF